MNKLIITKVEVANKKGRFVALDEGKDYTINEKEGTIDLNLAPIKDKMIMCRFDPDTFDELGKLAKKNNTSRGKIIRALVDASLSVPKGLIKAV